MRALALAICALLPVPLAAAPAPDAPERARPVGGRQKVSITVYNQGFALVKDQRPLRLDRGTNWLRFEEVAASIDPTTVAFRSLTAPEGVTVQEQNYQYDLITPANILQKSIGQPVRVRQFLTGGRERLIEGTLLSAGQVSVPAGPRPGQGQPNPATGIVVQGRDGVILAPEGQVEVPTLPPGLITRPALLWKVDAAAAGEHTGEISYLTGGVSWSSDYIARVNEDDTRIDLTGWVTLTNNSGVDYPDAEVKLVAGDVRREGATPAGPGRSAGYAGPGPTRTTPGEEGLFEYHLYTLPEATTLEDRSEKQINRVSATQVPVTKLFLFDPARAQWQRILTGGHRPFDYYAQMQPGQGRGTMAQQKVSVMLEIANTEANNLGFALPRGKARAYKADARGALQFVGEDWVDHTPANEKLRLYMGDAFDLVGVRKWTNYQVRQNGFEGTAEITLRNHKQEPVTIRVVEHLAGEWTVLEQSHDYEKKDAWTIEFPVPVPPDQEVKVTYRVRVEF